MEASGGFHAISQRPESLKRDQHLTRPSRIENSKYRMKDLLSPELLTDSRAKAATPELRRIYQDDHYEVFLARYPRGLLATMVHYKRESLRIMSALGEADGEAGGTLSWTERALELLRASNKAPLQLVLDAKLQTRLTITLHDRASLKLAGIEVPKSAGRYKDLFLQDNNQ